MENKLKLISSVCLGGYNDTMAYDTVIRYLGKEEHIEAEKFWDSRKEKDLWRIETGLNLSYEIKKAIVEILDKDLPSIFSDVKPKEYNKDITFEEKIKTLDGWNKSETLYLTDYLHIGDKVDRSLIDSLIDSVSPITLNGEIVQIGEAYSSDNKGRSTYLTFATNIPFGDWYYKGACLKGETINREYKFEEIGLENREQEIGEEIL